MIQGPPRIFDRAALALHRARARRVAGDAFLLEEAARGAADRIAIRSPSSGGWEDAATLIPFVVLLFAFLRAGAASADLDGSSERVA